VCGHLAVGADAACGLSGYDVARLERLGDGDFAPVFRLPLSDPSPAVRRDAAWTLRRTACAETWRELFEAWKGDQLPRHRLWACELAGEHGDESVGVELRALARDRDGHVRKAVARTLARWSDSANE
jgi:hypothetical protein